MTRRDRPGDGQRAQPRVPDRPARRGRAPGAGGARAPTTSGAGAPRCTASPARSTPTRCARRASAPTRRWRTPATARSASSTTSTTSPTARPYDEPNAMAIALAEAALEQGLEIVLLAGRLPPRRLGRRRPAARSRASGASATPTSRPSSSASTRCAAWAAGTPGVARRRRRRTASAPCRRAGSRRSARYADRHGLVRHVHACEQRRELDECARRARLHADRAARALRLPRARAPSVVHGIHVERRATSRCSPRSGTHRRQLPDDRGQPRRRLPARAALPRGGRADRDRHRLAGPHRPLRGGARARDRRAPRGPDALRPARGDRRPLGRAGRRRPRQPRPRRAGAEIEIDPAHPDLAGVARDGPPLRARDLRVGGRRRPRGRRRARVRHGDHALHDRAREVEHAEPRGCERR